MVGSLLTELKLQIKKKNNYEAAENWLNDQKWFSHDSGIPHIKLFSCMFLIKDHQWCQFFIPSGISEC
jgi:hypothetical protein